MGMDSVPWKKRGECALCDSISTGVLNRQGVQSVWNQQKGYFEGIKDDRGPRQIFVDDLCKEVEGWLEAGDHLVIGMDANNDVRRSILKSRLEKLGLVESITSRHRLNGPPTYMQYTQ